MKNHDKEIKSMERICKEFEPYNLEERRRMLTFICGWAQDPKNQTPLNPQPKP